MNYKYSDPAGTYNESGARPVAARHPDSEIYYGTERDTIDDFESSHPEVSPDHPYHVQLRALRVRAPWRTRVADEIISTACRLAAWVRK